MTIDGPQTNWFMVGLIIAACFWLAGALIFAVITAIAYWV